jgi:hypothetical protein
MPITKPSRTNGLDRKLASEEIFVIVRSMSNDTSHLIADAEAFLQWFRENRDGTFGLTEVSVFIAKNNGTAPVEYRGEFKQSLINYFNENASSLGLMHGFRWR